MRTIKTTVERFWEKVRKEEDHWMWTGAPTGIGYGEFRLTTRRNEKTIKTNPHRYSYVLHKGPIPDGLEIHHKCEIKLCVNPEHLDAVTHRENLMASDTIVARNLAKTECFRGHSLSGENLYVCKNGGRQCRTCQKERHNIWVENNAEYYKNYLRSYYRSRSSKKTPKAPTSADTV